MASWDWGLEKPLDELLSREGAENSELRATCARINTQFLILSIASVDDYVNEVNFEETLFGRALEATC
jgi:hypothetical protein